jgi:ABC-type uncharacterized transport system substrate-binding protein
MRRREFIALLGGAAAWPVMAGAQQAERMRRIGVLMNITADDPDARANNAAFLQVLQQLGWVDGRNVRIDTRWASGDAAQLRKYAAELAATAPDVIFASGTAAMGALSHATRTVPIVFNVVADPVGAGYVDSLARPGGNATGFMEFEYSLSAKWVELLKQIAPGVRRAAILRDPALSSGIESFCLDAIDLGLDLGNFLQGSGRKRYACLLRPHCSAAQRGKHGYGRSGNPGVHPARPRQQQRHSGNGSHSSLREAQQPTPPRQERRYDLRW